LLFCKTEHKQQATTAETALLETLSRETIFS